MNFCKVKNEIISIKNKKIKLNNIMKKILSVQIFLIISFLVNAQQYDSNESNTDDDNVVITTETIEDASTKPPVSS